MTTQFSLLTLLGVVTLASIFFALGHYFGTYILVSTLLVALLSCLSVGILRLPLWLGQLLVISCLLGQIISALPGHMHDGLGQPVCTLIVGSLVWGLLHRQVYYLQFAEGLTDEKQIQIDSWYWRDLKDCAKLFTLFTIVVLIGTAGYLACFDYSDPDNFKLACALGMLIGFVLLNALLPSYTALLFAIMRRKLKEG